MTLRNGRERDYVYSDYAHMGQKEIGEGKREQWLQAPVESMVQKASSSAVCQASGSFNFLL